VQLCGEECIVTFFSNAKKSSPHGALPQDARSICDDATVVAFAQSNHLRVSEHTGHTQYTLGQMAQRQQRVYRVVRSRSGIQRSLLGSGKRVISFYLQM
jgi:hypothetical protein